MPPAPGRLLLPTMLLLVAAIADCAPRTPGRPDLQVEGAWVRPTLVGATGRAGRNEVGVDDATSAAYFTIVNRGTVADTLIGVDADAAARADLHRSRTTGGIARMLPVPRLVVPAHGRIVCEPGGYHVMLMGVRRDLRFGERVRLVLHFRASGERVVDAPVSEGPTR